MVCAGDDAGEPSNLFKRVSNEITNFCIPSTRPLKEALSFSKTEILSNNSEPGILKLDTPSTRSRDDLMCCLAFAISVANVDVADDVLETPFCL